MKNASPGVAMLLMQMLKLMVIMLLTAGCADSPDYRLDGVFFVDLPSVEQRQAIWEI